MDSARLRHLQAIFQQAADLPAAQRPAFLHVACGDDDELRADVLGMLDADADGHSLFDRGVASMAGGLLGASPVPIHHHDAFGPYRLLRPIGEGGMGVVYLAERKDLGGRVAIKILRGASGLRPSSGCSPS